jgi:hypothetical protein
LGTFEQKGVARRGGIGRYVVELTWGAGGSGPLICARTACGSQQLWAAAGSPAMLENELPASVCNAEKPYAKLGSLQT